MNFDQIIFDAMCAIVGVVAIVIARYVVPWLKLHISEKQRNDIAFWAEKAVMYAEKMMQFSEGPFRKEAVFDFLKTVRDSEKLPIDDDQLEILIEAAVKALDLDQLEVGDIYIEDEEDEEDEDSFLDDLEDGEA